MAQGAANLFHPAPSGINPLHAAAIQSVGGSQPHNNFQPYLCVSFIISLFGIFPSQT
jgi:microcystin-dependent protein